MVFRGEVNDEARLPSLKIFAGRFNDQNAAWLHLARFAAFDIGARVPRELFVELKRDPFAHHADTIDRVNERLRSGIKQVAVLFFDPDFWSFLLVQVVQ